MTGSVGNAERQKLARLLVNHLVHEVADDLVAKMLANGVKAVKLPARSPDLNAYAERFVLSVKSECLAKIIPLGERHLRRAVKDYTEHYHQERNHQGLDNELIEKLIDGPDMDGTVDCRERLSGILNYYYRRVA